MKWAGLTAAGTAVYGSWRNAAAVWPAAAGTAAWTTMARTAVITVQLALIVAAVFQFEILNRAFFYLCLLVVVGFPVHAHLPQRLRLNFFLLLSVVGLFLVMGVANATWAVLLGLGLIGLCHLPLAFGWRVALVALAGVGLALFRSVANEFPGADGEAPHAILQLADRANFEPGVVLPILASLFMFRIIIYLYDLRTEQPGTPPLWRVSYFFLLPNVCFPLFPLVDYKQFRATYFNQDPHLIYQRGVNWIFRGIYHLLFYRLVYLYYALDPAEVSGMSDFVQYSVTSFLLYLRVSGTFHLATGLLLLFGFNLPETHHRYYLASSFTDFWRRINIYWKDFMRRIVFFPVHFHLRPLGDRAALVLSTAVVFFATWALHSYQYFWLTGVWLFEPHDALFWAILGVLVVLNVLYDARYGTERTWGPGRWSRWGLTALTLRTVATFTLITTLWGMWSSDSIEQWLDMWEGAGALAILLPALVAGGFFGSFLIERRLRLRGAVGATIRQRAARTYEWRMAAPTLAGTFALLVIGWPVVYGNLGTTVANVLETIREPGALNARDRNKLEKGYYEHLMSPNVTTGLWEVYTRKSPEKLRDTVAWRETPDVLEGELIPGTRMLYRGANVSVNSHGLRDQEYPLPKPVATTRIAFLGTSHTMGVGVEDDETFEAVLEKSLNRDAAAAGARQRYELLNFGVGGYGPLQYLHLAEHRVPRFDANIMVVIGHLQDPQLLTGSMAKLLSTGRSLPYPDIELELQAAGIKNGMPASVIERQLRPIAERLLALVYARIAAAARDQGAVPVWVFLPIAYQDPSAAELARRMHMMREAGLVALSLAGAFDGRTPHEVQVSDWDTHPNALGHRLLAQRLGDELKRAGLLRTRGTTDGAGPSFQSVVGQAAP